MSCAMRTSSARSRSFAACARPERPRAPRRMCTGRSEREDSRPDLRMRFRAMRCERRAPLPSDEKIARAKRDERAKSRHRATKMRRTLVWTRLLRFLTMTRSRRRLAPRRHRPLRGSGFRSTRGTSHRSSGSERHPRAPRAGSPTKSCALPSTQSREPRFASACATRAGSELGSTEEKKTNRRAERRKTNPPKKKWRMTRRRAPSRSNRTRLPRRLPCPHMSRATPRTRTSRVTPDDHRPVRHATKKNEAREERRRKGIRRSPFAAGGARRRRRRSPRSRRATPSFRGAGGRVTSRARNAKPRENNARHSSPTPWFACSARRARGF